MSNNNDWSNHQDDWEAGAQKPQVEIRGNSDMLPTSSATGHPLGNNRIDVGAFIDIVRFTFESAKKTPILKAFVGLLLVSLVVSLIQASIQTVGALAGGIIAGLMTVVSILVGLIGFVLGMIVIGLLYSLYKPLTQVLSGETLEQSEPIELIKAQIGSVFMLIIAYILVILGTGIGMMMCFIPGLIFGFLFCQVPYLIASQDAELVAAFQLSMDRAKRHWALVLMPVAATFATMVVLGIPMGGVIAVGSFIPVVGPIVSTVGMWILSASVILVGIMTTTAAFATIDELDGLRKIQR